MNKKPENNDIPDFSAVFNVDKDSVPRELIKKDPGASTENLGLLSGENELSPKEQKEKQKKVKAENNKKKVNRRKNRAIAVLSAVVLLFIAVTCISIGLREARKPVITAEKPVVQAISRYTEGNAVTISSGTSFKVVFIDNDYDVHYIEPGQSVELINENGTVYTGKVTDITEAFPDSYYIKDYHSVLTGEMPSTVVYAVFVTPDDSAAFTKEGVPLKAKVLTKTVTDALTVRSSAVFADGNRYYVWKYSSFAKALSKQDVKVGLSVDGVTEIMGGIEKSDRIATVFSCSEDKLYDGIKVKTD